jgi:type II secretory pathway pseudopilin PulG
MSIVEVLVVIAIIGIMAASGAAVFVSQSDFYARKAASSISEALSQTRANALARESAWMKLEYDSTKNTYILTTSFGTEAEDLGNRFNITFESKTKRDVTSETHDLKTDGPVILSYNRSNGAFLGMIDSISSSTDSGDGKEHITFTYKQDGIGDDYYCTRITIKQGEEHEYDMTLYPDTGKHESKRVIVQ